MGPCVEDEEDAWSVVDGSEAAAGQVIDEENSGSGYRGVRRVDWHV